VTDDATVTVCVPTIPARAELLDRALRSVAAQRNVAVTSSVTLDDDGSGAAATRNRAWRAAETEWVAFLDDDDVLRPNHVELCLRHALDTNADLVYPWFNIHNRSGRDITNRDPLSVPVGGRYVSPYGVAFNDDLRRELETRNNFIPVTVLVRRSLLEQVGGFPLTNTPEWPEDCCEDWGLWRRLLGVGARFEHLPRRTWIWMWHGGNTSGQPSRSRR
jgi:glycosyltransferase involved in cell wall biosynthesis